MMPNRCHFRCKPGECKRRPHCEAFHERQRVALETVLMSSTHLVPPRSGDMATMVEDIQRRNEDDMCLEEFKRWVEERMILKIWERWNPVMGPGILSRRSDFSFVLGKYEG